MAAARMAAEPVGHTLDATALVHDAYLRLIGDQQFDGRGLFFAAAAEAMRRILVESARRRAAAKRTAGGSSPGASRTSRGSRLAAAGAEVTGGRR
jgi:ECF sigma factor